MAPGLAEVVHGGPRIAVYFLVHLRSDVPAVPGSQGTGRSQHVPSHDIEFYICRLCLHRIGLHVPTIGWVPSRPVGRVSLCVSPLLDCGWHGAGCAGLG